MQGLRAAPPPTNDGVATLYRRLLRLIRFLAVSVLVALVAVVMGSVVVRYFGLFQGSLHWAQELARFAVVWMVMLGCVLGLDRGAHMSVEVLPDSLAPPLRRAIGVLALGIAATFLALLAWHGFMLAFATMGQVSPALGVPMGWVYLSIPVGASLMLGQSALFALRPDLRGTCRASDDVGTSHDRGSAPSVVDPR